MSNTNTPAFETLTGGISEKNFGTALYDQMARLILAEGKFTSSDGHETSFWLPDAIDRTAVRVSSYYNLLRTGAPELNVRSSDQAHTDRAAFDKKTLAQGKAVIMLLVTTREVGSDYGETDFKSYTKPRIDMHMCGNTPPSFQGFADVVLGEPFRSLSAQRGEKTNQPPLVIWSVPNKPYQFGLSGLAVSEPEIIRGLATYISRNRPV